MGNQSELTEKQQKVCDQFANASLESNLGGSIDVRFTAHGAGTGRVLGWTVCTVKCTCSCDKQASQEGK